MKFRSYHKLRQSMTVHAKSAGQSYSAAICAALYNYPKITNPNPQKTIYLLELGGGYSVEAINLQFTTDGLPPPQITDVSVLGATNSYTGDGNGPDGEVELDITCAGEAYSYMTGRPAKICVVFCPNSDEGFQAGVAWIAANSDGGPASISWGGPEDQTDDISQMDAAFKAGVVGKGIQYCCAAGDNDSGDGESGQHDDYPGSSPYVIDCGGTSILTSVVNGVRVITNESVWNSGGGEGTGGGPSAVEALPSWQVGFVPVGSKRSCPDLSLNADPASGYNTPFGVIGGTSASAPMMAALVCVMCEARQPTDTLNAFFYPNEPAFRDITAGNNGAFSATKGYDKASGLGVPIGNTLYSDWTAGVVTPPPISPPGSPPPPVSPPPIVLPPPPVVPPPPVSPPPVVNPLPPTNNVLREVIAIIDGDFQEAEQAVSTIPVYGRLLVHYLQTFNSALDSQIVEIFGSTSATSKALGHPKAIDFPGLLTKVEVWLQTYGRDALPLIKDIIDSTSLSASEKQLLEDLITKVLGTFSVTSTRTRQYKSTSFGNGVVDYVKSLIYKYGKDAIPLINAVIEWSPLNPLEKQLIEGLLAVLVSGVSQ